MKEFFDKHIKIIKDTKARCSECGGTLRGWYDEVAHILPKSYFKSISEDDSNIVYLCHQCHTNYDSWSNERTHEMVIAGDIEKSCATLKDKITEKINWKHIDRWPGLA